MAIRKSKTPYVRDVYLAYLIDGARRTETDEFPIIEEWMVATEPPKEIIQWDRKYVVGIFKKKEDVIDYFVDVQGISDDDAYEKLMSQPLFSGEALKNILDKIEWL